MFCLNQLPFSLHVSLQSYDPSLLRSRTKLSHLFKPMPNIACLRSNWFYSVSFLEKVLNRFSRQNPWTECSKDSPAIADIYYCREHMPAKHKSCSDGHYSVGGNLTITVRLNKSFGWTESLQQPVDGSACEIFSVMGLAWSPGGQNIHRTALQVCQFSISKDERQQYVRKI